MPRHRPHAPLYNATAGSLNTTAAVEFLDELWNYKPRVYTFLATRRASTGAWREHPIRGERAAQATQVLEQHPPISFDVYFCPNGFAEPRRLADLARPSRYAWSDIDDADPSTFRPKPNVLWETSPGRFQGLWIWKKTAEVSVAEQYSQNIWLRDGGDKGGWSITKLLRLPGTINHKPQYEQPIVRLIRFDQQPQRLPKKLRDAPASTARAPRSEIESTAHDPVEVIAKYRRAMGLEARSLITATRVMRNDRSKRVFQIVTALSAAGASAGEIASVLLVNPYFVEKWGADLAQAERQIATIRARSEAS